MCFKQQILELRQEGKTYNQIKDIVKCSISTISYYCGDGQKTKNQERQLKRRLVSHPYVKKLEHFKCRKAKNLPLKMETSKVNNVILLKIRTFTGVKHMKDAGFTIQDVLNKFGNNPKCYITGDDIDISKPRTYHFDHIIPTSRGGDNSLDNLGLATRNANQSKYDLTLDEYIHLCKRVLENNGYMVQKQ